jgi:toxin ParE1/3/4
VRFVRLTAHARQDIAAIYEYSLETFGDAARNRYELLINSALRALAEDPSRAGIQSRAELDDGVLLYHVRHARMHLPRGARVGAPRHYILFRADEEKIVVLRILHDAMDVLAHLPREDD